MPDQEGDPGRLAERLEEAFRRLRNSSLTDEQKSRLTRRLLAVTRTAKHDVHLAARRLEPLLGQLSHAERTPEGPEASANGGPDGSGAGGTVGG
jgi:hypothetical protein